MKIEFTGFEEIKLNKEDVVKYKSQKNVQRQKERRGGYDYVIYATDQDLDWPKGQSILT